MMPFPNNIIDWETWRTWNGKMNRNVLEQWFLLLHSVEIKIFFKMVFLFPYCYSWRLELFSKHYILFADNKALCSKDYINFIEKDTRIVFGHISFSDFSILIHLTNFHLHEQWHLIMHFWTHYSKKFKQRQSFIGLFDLKAYRGHMYIT